MHDRAFDIACVAIVFAALVYADWAARTAHQHTVEAYERVISFLQDIADEDVDDATALSPTQKKEG